MFGKITGSLKALATNLTARFASVDAMAWVGVLFIVASLALASQGR